MLTYPCSHCGKLVTLDGVDWIDSGTRLFCPDCDGPTIIDLHPSDLWAWNAILRAEGPGDWSIIFAIDGYCWHHDKTIQLPETATNSLFLHELAHALCPDPEPYGQGMHYHGGTWAATFGKLVDKYMELRATQNMPQH